MTLFRANSENPFKGPHQPSEIYETGAPLMRAKAAMILIHGRGATARGMLPLAEELAQPDVHYAAPQANGRTWYPYSFLMPTEKNEPGISSGLQVLHDLVTKISKAGIPKEKIMILGFSQGACLAAEFLARHPQKPGGLIALSGGLIGPEIDIENYGGNLQQTPVFLGCSEADPHIPASRLDETEKVFNQLQGNVIKRIYPGSAHTINQDEIKHVRRILAAVLNASA